MTKQSDMNPQVLTAKTLIGDKVRNEQGENLGEIQDLMIDLDRGCIAYAVLSFGGILGMGDKLFAVPWQALDLRPEEHVFVLNVDKETLKNAPGFDKNNWPTTANREWMTKVYSFYGYEPYWTTSETTGTNRTTGGTTRTGNY